MNLDIKYIPLFPCPVPPAFVSVGLRPQSQRINKGQRLTESFGFIRQGQGKNSGKGEIFFFNLTLSFGRIRPSVLRSFGPSVLRSFGEGEGRVEFGVPVSVFNLKFYLLRENYKMKTSINKFQFFPFHLVDPSPWPILLSFSLLNLAIAGVLYFHGFKYGGALLILGFILTSSGMALWFRDVITEGTYLGHHTKEVKNGLIIGVILFIISEVFAFLSIFWAFFHSSLSPAIEIGGSWPPVGITPLDPFAIPLLNTFLLLSSGAFITYGHHALIAGNRKAAIDGVFICVVLACVFTGLQYYEYSEAGFTMSDGVYGSAFYASTGLHGFHVIVGTIFILVGFIRIINYQLTKEHHQGFEASILYWHFVDVVWLFLFVAVYFWGGA